MSIKTFLAIIISTSFIEAMTGPILDQGQAVTISCVAGYLICDLLDRENK